MILSRNLESLSRYSPDVAQLIRDAAPVPIDGFRYKGRSLCSTRATDRESDRLAGTVDPVQTAVAVSVGFGAGFHVGALVRRMGREGQVLVYEPDVPLMRAVLERVDHSAWLGSPTLSIVTETENLTEVLSPGGAYAAMGSAFVEHPADGARLGEDAVRFREAFNRAFATVRTHLMTGMLHAERTMENQLANLAKYVTSRGIADLKDKCKGRACITIAAGPSLARNVKLLAGARGRYVLIAAQTVLKPLLAMGIVPHFVCALDWSPLCRHFYEGLTGAAVRGCHLVCESTCNPIIPKLWPGVLRFTGDQLLDDLLEPVCGAGYAAAMGEIPRRPNVAQMCYDLGRYMGCDPVIMTGQDLGYTDGQYYGLASGTTRDQWACELNGFRSVEMCEWERIARNKAGTRKVPAQGGGEVHTDALMMVYLSSFREMWKADLAAGLRVVDATEGGVDKSPATAMTLREAMVTYRPPETLELNGTGMYAEPLRNAVERAGRMQLTERAGST